MTEADRVDVAVLGGGPAGAAAAIMAKRLGAAVALVEPMSVGGEAINIPELEGLPEQDPVPGPDLVTALTERVMDEGVELRLGEVASGLEGAEGDWRVRTESGPLSAGAVILCTGARHVPLPGRPGDEEDPLHGAGLFTCAPCDAPVYAGKRVAVAGGGDTGADGAITLSEYARGVLLFEREEKLTCRPAARERLEQLPNVELRCGAEVTEVLGEGALEGIIVRGDRGEAKEVVDGLMIAVGLRPRSELVAQHVELDDAGAVLVEADLRTTAAGLYAAGDVRAGSPYRCGAAWGDGLSAATAAVRELWSAAG